ncbi:hypothetical protein COP2_039244 [Malus domestica]
MGFKSLFSRNKKSSPDVAAAHADVPAAHADVAAAHADVVATHPAASAAHLAASVVVSAYSRTHIIELDQVFKKFDVNGNKKISSSELGAIMSSLGQPSSDEFSSKGYIDGKNDRRLNNCPQYSIVAGKKALVDANLGADQRSKLDQPRTGMLVGSGICGLTVVSDGVHALIEKGCNPATVSDHIDPITKS